MRVELVKQSDNVFNYKWFVSIALGLRGGELVNESLVENRYCFSINSKSIHESSNVHFNLEKSIRKLVTGFGRIDLSLSIFGRISGMLN